MLNLFYEEPEHDRWVPFDRYPRRLIRRVVRGKTGPGGHGRVYLNLRAGLDRLGVPYRINDYKYAERNHSALACIIGKPHVLDRMEWKNPILLGSAIYSHPIDNPELFERFPVRKVLVPGRWMECMCRPFWGDKVAAWPVGIDTELWHPDPAEQKTIDVLLYDKVRWEHEKFEEYLINPIRSLLRTQGRSAIEFRYGFYREEDFRKALAQCKTMIFLCEHETQGIAYQQALSCGVPIFAWDRAGYWEDPNYYPQRVKFAPVSSVPYWDERCGGKFADAAGFCRGWEEFWEDAEAQRYRPRDYILENLTLEKCAGEYLAFAEQNGG